MSTQPIVLLVRADDIGFSHAANEACIRVFTHGICRSVEVMAPTPWFPEAVKLLKARPTFDVGVHFTLTSEWENYKWRPLTGPSSVAAEDGFFYRTFRKNDNYPDEITFEQGEWVPADVEKELRAQIELVRKHIPWVSHATFHMGGLRDNPNFQGVVDGLVQEYGLGVDVAGNGFERFRAFGENSQAKTSQEKVEALRENLAVLQPGRWIHVDHPCLDTHESRAVWHVGYEEVAVDRQGVVDAWTDSRVLEIVAERGIRLVSYGDVKNGAL
ncbi:MAG: ChbG/HpnK family deacetylase [Chloroflexi bacterium]|nr:ChbG/HpnK family deacetylase [Chloroflexota bacterium]